jgi:hypothetical protein
LNKSEFQAVVASVQMRESFLVFDSFLLQLFFDHFLDRVGGSFIIAAHHIRIDIQRDRWIGVPETLRDCSQRNAPAQQLGSMGMSQVVEAGVSCTDAPREGDVCVREIVRSPASAVR